MLSREPQGGFITRKPTPVLVSEDPNGWGDGGFGFFFNPNANRQPVNTRQQRGGGGQYYYQQQQPGYPPQQQGNRSRNFW